MAAIEPTSDDALIVDHYWRHWIEMGVLESEVREDWREQALGFLREARSRDCLGAFVAKEDGLTVGSACCQLTRRTFPLFRKGDAARIGYLWGVYVEVEHRGRGVGQALVTACMSHLRTLNCGRVLLHASEASAPLYKRLGFDATSELARKL